MQIIINGKSYQAEKNQPVLQVALDNNIYIPHFCYHEDLEVEANCRTCLVEIVKPGLDTKEKAGEIVTSCTLKASEGLEINTQSKKAIALRQENLSLLLSHHKFNCNTCPRGSICAVNESIVKDKVNIAKYRSTPTDMPVVALGTAAEFDSNVCIACNQCVKICEEIGIGYLKLEGNGVYNRVVATDDPTIDCIYCGQCTVHCPVAAIREQTHLPQVEEAINDPNKIVIAQMAPSVRVSIGELFKMEIGKNIEKKLNTAFRQIGFDKIFDVNFGADITTLVEANELINRIENNGVMPMFTSCCPAWVKFIEFYYPEMIPHLTTVRSPQIHAGGAYKTWWAEKEGIDPKNIVVVSIMPCTSKKYEASHEKLKINDMFPVDYVLTTRETATLIKRHKIDLETISSSESDILGEYSGAGAIYGASGGVMESALRTISYQLLKKDIGRLEFTEVRGMEGIKKATVTLADKELHVAVVATPKNARIILEEIKNNPKAYDYIEFMACPGGCIGGGGQPIPSTKRIIKKRTEGLYQIDSTKSCHSAHENKLAVEFIEYCHHQSKEKSDQLLHTTYSKKQRGE